MNKSDTKVRIMICLLLMAGIAILALAWWGGSYLSIALVIISLACFGTMLYAWMTERRITKLLDKLIRTLHERHR